MRISFKNKKQRSIIILIVVFVDAFCYLAWYHHVRQQYRMLCKARFFPKGALSSPAWWK